VTALTGAEGRVAPVRVGWGTVVRVGWLESRRLIRNPVFLAAGLLSGYLALQPWWNGTPTQSWSTELFDTVPVMNATIMTGAAFVAASLLALRDSDRTTRELLRTSPATAVDRTLGLALAGAVPVLVFAATIVWLRVLVARAGGIPVGDSSIQLMPSAGHLAGPILVVGVSWMLGIAVARTIRSRALAIVLGVLGVYSGQVMYWIWAWFPAFFLMPYASPLTPVDQGIHIEDLPQHGLGLYADGHWLILQEDRVLWHGCYLIGVAVLLTAYACWRSGPDRRTRWIALAGLLLAAAGFAGQVIAWGGEVRWFEQAWSL